MVGDCCAPALNSTVLALSPGQDSATGQGAAQGRCGGQRHTVGVAQTSQGNGNARRVRVGRSDQMEPHDARSAQDALVRCGLRWCQHAGTPRCHRRAAAADQGARAWQAEPLRDGLIRFPHPARAAQEVRERVPDGRRRAGKDPGREIPGSTHRPGCDPVRPELPTWKGLRPSPALLRDSSCRRVRILVRRDVCSLSSKTRGGRQFLPMAKQEIAFRR